MSCVLAALNEYFGLAINGAGVGNVKCGDA